MQRRARRVAAWMSLLLSLSTAAAAAAEEGPRLWRVATGDHELVVLGSLVPLPSQLSWNQNAITEHLSRSEALLAPPGVDLEGGLAWLGMAARVPMLLRARNNPDDLTLGEILPPALLQRWARQREEYLPTYRSIDRRRPIAAADLLQKKALARHGFELGNQVAEQVDRIARRYGVARIDTALPLSLDKVQGFLDDLAEQPLEDQPCFEQILARVEAGPQPLRAQAESWRIGAVEDLAGHPLGSTFEICTHALLAHPLARKHGLDDLPERARLHWLEIAERTLLAKRRSVAVLPMSLVLGESGYLAEMQRRGFRVEPSVLDPKASYRLAEVSQRLSDAREPGRRHPTRSQCRLPNEAVTLDVRSVEAQTSSHTLLIRIAEPLVTEGPTRYVGAGRKHAESQ